MSTEAKSRRLEAGGWGLAAVPLLTRPDLWLGRGLATAPAGVSTGFAALDLALPWRGWPPASLAEVLTAHPGAGLGLLLPLLVTLGRGSRWLVLVDPPFIPYAPALAARGLDLSRLVVVRAGDEAAWAIEQALRSGACGAVLGWPRETAAAGQRGQDGSAGPGSGRAGRGAGAGAGTRTGAGRTWGLPMLRRLQLAAAAGDAIGLLLRSPAAAAVPSPAALRLAVEPAADGLAVEVLKLRGGRAGARLALVA